MESKLTVSIVALTLNEVDGVKVILPAIRPEWYDQLVIVDGGSRDGTVEWCREHGYKVFEQRRRGIRFAAGSEVADSSRGQYRCFGMTILGRF